MIDYSLRKRPKKSIDKRVIRKDEDLRRRIRLAINFIADVRDLTNETMALVMGAKIWNLANYRAMNTSPKYGFVISFCKAFDFNEDWLWKGKGEPFPGAAAKYPNYFGQETSPPASLYIKEGEADYAAAGSAHISGGETIAAADAAQKINIDEAWGKVYRILKSGTPYAVALYLNIQQFSAALDTVMELKVCRDDIADLKAQVAALRREVEGLKAPPVSSDQPAAFLEKAAM